ncbi:putative high-affinity nicotinic acid transporter [Suhomyces tanzawaensis NRRL Y-17324]|uniref:Putative high-affinity nicotinic acid transporter n=1 Tax=Suhomyces tanzawaensis NRRL Y-17324 TaxID=984487 RepID=A0A1E4SI07_9ASCO|nr:putative high-affinity nicotinic acid transporter [Suhomyces tanzawaensis NRRL Y-17324]ODV79148.1 putative high-affinity nicotinic acid transporter [Suhomyces tanzawaensis NRRL Y-17324]
MEQLSKELGVDDKKLMWKIDACVIPPFCLLYFLSFLDRVNISNANVYGLSEDLGLTGNQYNIALTVFFVPYVFFEVISNYIIKFVKPHVWLSACILSFGAISIGMGFVKNFGGLVVCRFLIGFTESGTFPSIFYLLGCFYTKAESQRRFSAFFSVTALAGAASGAIAYKIHELDGKHGLAAWQWIFIIEGAVTCGCAGLLFMTIADFPEECRFLKANEREFLKRKLEIYSGAASAYEITNTVKDVLNCFKDLLVWLPALAYLGMIVPAYGYAYFAATIIRDMGYTAASANQHSVYPWLAAFFMMNIVAFLSDRFRKRLPFFLASAVIGIAGLAMILGAKDSPNVRYGGCFLTAAGLYTAMPLMVCWAALNMGSHIRKSVGTAWQVGFGNIGGIIATFIFLKKDAPGYVPGLSVAIAGTCFAILCGLAYFFTVYRLNRVKQTDSYKQKFYAMDERAQVIAGDLNPNFTYSY